MASINLGVGRKRISRQMQPHEAGYVANITGQMDHLRATIKSIVDRVENLTPAALKHGLKPIFDTSQVLVPVDKGRLKRSGFIETRRGVRGVSASVGYAKSGRPHYAVLVHERLEFQHAAGTQAKFLEEAVNRHVDEIGPRIATYLKRNVGISG